MTPRRLAPLLALLALLLAPATAAAFPADFRYALAVGEDSFGRLYESREAFAEPAGIVAAERLASEEIRLDALAPGRAHVFVTGPSLLYVFAVQVRAAGEPKPPPPALDPAKLSAAKRACAGLDQRVEAGRPVIEVTIGDRPCRDAIAALAADDAILAADLQLTFTTAQLQEQLVRLQRAVLDAKLPAVTLHYQGASLVVRGTVTTAERLTLLRTLWRHALGRIALYEELTVVEPPAAPTEAPPPAVMTLEEARKAGLLDDDVPKKEIAP